MNSNYQFKIGQFVKMIDPEDGHALKGTVTDTVSNAVFIQWEHLREPTEHPQYEFEKIKLIHPRPTAPIARRSPGSNSY